MSDQPDDELVVLRCDVCGNTFTAHRVPDAPCPRCGSESVHLAHEPLL